MQGEVVCSASLMSMGCLSSLGSSDVICDQDFSSSQSSLCKSQCVYYVVLVCSVQIVCHIWQLLDISIGVLTSVLSLSCLIGTEVE